MDLFVEEEAGAGFYRTPDGKAAFETRVETILVKDDDPVTITVRQTRHGPVISDVLGDRADGLILALAATALDAEDVTAQAFYNMHRARDWPAFVEALRDFGTPQQNVAYADKDGNIGFYVPGRVPVRRAGDGTVPRPGGRRIRLARLGAVRGTASYRKSSKRANRQCQQQGCGRRL